MSNLGSLPCGFKWVIGVICWENLVSLVQLREKTRGTAYLVLCEGSVTDKMSAFSDLITICCFQSHFFL